MYYLIRETLEPCVSGDIYDAGVPFVAILTRDEWQMERGRYFAGIDMDTELRLSPNTRAVVNYDSLTGSIAVPDKGIGEQVSGAFAFALDEKGVVFVDDTGMASRIIQNIAETKRWRMPGLERFIYDFLEQIIAPDLARLEQQEQSLDHLEEKILSGDAEKVLPLLNNIRGELLDLNLHYGQLMDLGQELEENENGFFAEENLRYFRLFSARAERLRDKVAALRDYTVQLRDLIQTRVDMKQNRIMTLLTVITTIFTPLTLITGWYGMNFYNMPELKAPWGYPMVIIVCLLIAGFSLWYFKKKKWL